MIEQTEKLLEAQQAVIGSMLIDEKVVGLALSEATTEDFPSGACRMVFEAFRALSAEGAPCDPVTVNAKLGGDQAKYLMELMDITPSAKNIRSYLEILKREARVARLHDVAGRMAEETDEEALRKLIAEANALTVERPGIRMIGMRQALESFYERHDPNTRPEYLNFGMAAINENVYAGQGDMIVIGGYPSDGKTSLALTLAVGMAQRQRVGFFSFETDCDKLFDRIMAATALVGLPKLKLNAMGEHDWESVAAVAPRIEKTQLELIEASGMSVQDIRAYALARRYGVIFIDYLQKIRPAARTRNASDYETVSQISSDLQKLGRQTGIPVVALSQLSRPEKSKSGKIPPPTLTALRSSGQIEQDADVVMLLYREEPDNSRSRRILNIAKNKEGEANIALYLAFDGQTQTFKKSATQYKKPEPKEQQMGFTELAADTPVPWDTGGRQGNERADVGQSNRQALPVHAGLHGALSGVPDHMPGMGEVRESKTGGIR